MEKVERCTGEEAATFQRANVPRASGCSIIAQREEMHEEALRFRHELRSCHGKGRPPEHGPALRATGPPGTVPALRRECADRTTPRLSGAHAGSRTVATSELQGMTRDRQ